MGSDNVPQLREAFFECQGGRRRLLREPDRLVWCRCRSFNAWRSTWVVNRTRL